MYLVVVVVIDAVVVVVVVEIRKKGVGFSLYSGHVNENVSV